MFVGNILSTTDVAAPLVGARALPISGMVDYEDGGIGISDPSEGLLYQIWKATIVDAGGSNKEVYFEAPNTAPHLVYSGGNITEISFTFDQNMRPVLAFVENDLPYFRWYDSSAEAQVVTALDSGVINPRVFLDDKRVLQRGNSDIILGYIKADNLYFRMQRDRFGVEYLLKEGVLSLSKIGMNRQLRLQFMVMYNG